MPYEHIVREHESCALIDWFYLSRCIGSCILIYLGVIQSASFCTAETQLKSRSAIPQATVRNGTLSGLHSTAYDQDYFLGIPYAQPPVGSLRFRQAQSLNTTWTGALNVTEYSSECIGYGSDDWVLGNDVSEDCLTLNVIRPAGYENQKLPVGVWIVSNFWSSFLPLIAMFGV